MTLAAPGGAVAESPAANNPHATEHVTDWDKIANDTVGILRAEAGRDPHDKRLSDLTLDFESFELPGDPGQTLLVYSAEPGSHSHQALQLLASWASTPHDEPADRSS